MAYTPNFQDPRVRARCSRACAFVSAVMSSTESRSWSTRYIDRYLGSQRNSLSKWLRSQLLICTRSTWIQGHRCKEYRLNAQGLLWLRSQIGLDQDDLEQEQHAIVGQEHSRELSSGQFQYHEQSDRLWHPLQRYRRELRTRILEDEGYRHHYDIESAAITLCLQYSQQQAEPMDLWLESLEQLRSQKDLVRQRLAEDVGCDIKTAKLIITALFGGAHIAARPDGSIYQYLGYDRARLELLRTSKWIQQFRSDLQILWQSMRSEFPVRTIKTRQGYERRLPVRPSDKWRLYFRLERLVMASIREYLDRRSVRYFLIHDGWASDQEIDRSDLEQWVYADTGYRIRIDYKRS